MRNENDGVAKPWYLQEDIEQSLSSGVSQPSHNGQESHDLKEAASSWFLQKFESDGPSKADSTTTSTSNINESSSAQTPNRHVGAPSTKSECTTSSEPLSSSAVTNRSGSSKAGSSGRAEQESFNLELPSQGTSSFQDGEEPWPPEEPSARQVEEARSEAIPDFEDLLQLCEGERARKSHAITDTRGKRTPEFHKKYWLFGVGVLFAAVVLLGILLKR